MLTARPRALAAPEADAPFLRQRVEATELSGLRNDSDVMVDKITTVQRSNLDQRVGRLITQQIADVERLVVIVLRLAS